MIFKLVKPDLIHLAGQSTIDYIKKMNTKNNIDITNNIIDVIKINKIKHLIFSSTAAVYKVSNNCSMKNLSYPQIIFVEKQN